MQPLTHLPYPAHTSGSPLLKSPHALSEEEKAKLKDILSNEIYPLTGKVYKLKLAFQDLFKLTKEEAKLAFYEWLNLSFTTGSKALCDVAYTFIQKEKLVFNWFQSKVSNGFFEGLNSVLQTTKRKARGYRNPQNLIAMSYLLHGKLNVHSL